MLSFTKIKNKNKSLIAKCTKTCIWTNYATNSMIVIEVATQYQRIRGIFGWDIEPLCNLTALKNHNIIIKSLTT